MGYLGGGTVGSPSSEASNLGGIVNESSKFYEIEPAIVTQVDKLIVGKIKIYSLLSNVELDATPLNENIKMIPLVGELVLFRMYKIQPFVGEESVMGIFYEMFPYSKSPHFNVQAFISDFRNLYSQGKSKLIDSKIAGVPLKTKEYLNENYFTYNEQHDSKLVPFEGDVIFQGRSGQSIRFGSSIPKEIKLDEISIYKSALWKNSSTNKGGLPFILISNGKTSFDAHFDAYSIESISDDPSVIFMTHGGDGGVEFPFQYSSLKTMTNSVKLKTVHSDSTILLNSDYIALNSRKNNIILSSNNNIVLSSNTSIFISTNSMFEIKSNIVSLGENAPVNGQAVTKSDDLSKVLNDLIDGILMLKYDNYGSLIPNTDYLLKVVKARINSKEFYSKTTFTL